MQPKKSSLGRSSGPIRSSIIRIGFVFGYSSIITLQNQLGNSFSIYFLFSECVLNQGESKDSYLFRAKKQLIFYGWFSFDSAAKRVALIYGGWRREEGGKLCCSFGEIKARCGGDSTNHRVVVGGCVDINWANPWSYKTVIFGDIYHHFGGSSICPL
jgi:hypothetical protein